MANNAKIIDVDLLVQAGIDPKSGLPLKTTSGRRCSTKSDIKRILRIKEEQEYCSRYTWYNIPMNLTSQEIERMLYYKGQLAFFYIESLDQFMLLPYALNGTIDAYGRYNSITPVAMSSGDDPKNKQRTPLAQLLQSMKLDCIYGMKQLEELKPEDLTKSAVLLYDYDKQLGQTITPRQVINDPLIDVEADCIPYMRTALLNQTGVKGVRVGDADQADNVADASRSLNGAALEGDPYVAIVGNMDFQEMTNGVKGTSEEFMLAMQALDNFRLSTMGINNGGLFQKKAHELQTEADMNGGPVDLVLQSGLNIRQTFCLVVQSIWGIPIWCEISENITMGDMNGDGMLNDRNQEGQQGQDGGVYHNE